MSKKNEVEVHFKDMLVMEEVNSGVAADRTVLKLQELDMIECRTCDSHLRFCRPNNLACFTEETCVVNQSFRYMGYFCIDMQPQHSCGASRS